MAKDLFDRYIWLVDTIYRAGKITLDEINERWLRSKYSDGREIPLRTFHNWRNAIEDTFDINIECSRQGGYYYYIENADDIESGGIRNWLLNTFAVNNLINESHHLKRRILFEEIPSGQQYLTPIIEAMRDNLEIELVHQSYWRNSESTYTVQPYCVKVFKQRWYMTGYCRERDALRTFALDRIHKLTTLATKFNYPKDFDPKDYFDTSFGIIAGDEFQVQTIRIKVYEMHCQYVRALPLHHSQREIETNEWYSIFEYRMKLTFDFKQELISHGDDIEVIYPQSLRDEIINEIKKLCNRYDILLPRESAE